MPKLFYPFDAQAFWMRTGFAVLLSGMAILVGVGFVLYDLGLPRNIVGGLTVPPILLLLTWDVALPLFVRQRLDDGLSLDESGLAGTHRGRTESWRWDEISGFRLHSRWHPMGLLIGRSITFRGARPSGRSPLAGLFNRIVFGGGNIAFGDNYLVVSEELADRLNWYRDMATGAAPKPAPAPAAPQPALFTVRESLDPGKRSKALLVLLGTGLAGIVVTVGIVMWTDDSLPVSVEGLVTSDRLFAMLLPAFLIFVQSLSRHFWQQSPAANLILAAAGGLHTRRGLQRRHWRWDEIADIEVKTSAPAADDRSSGQAVGFSAYHDGTRPGRPPPDGPAHALLTVFNDVYDAPAREIGRQLESWARWGQAHAGPVSHDALPETSSAVRRLSSAMRFQRQAARRFGAFRTPAMWLFWMLMLGSLVPTLLILRLARGGTPVSGLLLAALGLGLLSLFGGFGVLLTSVSGSLNYLEVDRSGLVYRRLGWRMICSWRELGGFELRSAALRWSGTKRLIVLFTAPRDDRISRYLRWAYGIGGTQPRIVIEDVYDIAASEILATIQQHHRNRDRRAAPRAAE